MFISFDRSRKFPATSLETFCHFLSLSSGAPIMCIMVCFLVSLFGSLHSFLFLLPLIIISDGLYFNLMILLLDQVHCLILIEFFKSVISLPTQKFVWLYLLFLSLLIVSFNSCLIFQSSLSIFMTVIFNYFPSNAYTSASLWPISDDLFLLL